MDDSELLRRTADNMWAFYRAVGENGDGGRTLERDGVLAAIAPAAPERSVINSVLYREAGALDAALADLAAAYDDAGVNAWTVWIHASDPSAARAAERAGHVLDATPQAMGLELEGLSAELPPGLEWEVSDDHEGVVDVISKSYGWSEDEMRGGILGGLAAGRIYLARLDGAPACTVVAFDEGDDCGIYGVGTVPEARGKGLCRGLMAQALVDARERGCATSTLQATRMGRPIYQRLGYRDLGAFEMWERRKPSSASPTVIGGG